MPREALADRFTRFAERYFRGSSPLYERLAHATADDPVALAIASRARRGQAEPLLLLAAVHHLLLGGLEHPLADWFPSVAADPVRTDDAAPAFRDLARRHRAALEALVERRVVQTNEVRRCTALFPGLLAAAARAPGQPLALLEVGASAGLNLRLDRYRYEYAPGGASGAPAAAIVLRCGVRGSGPVPRARPPEIAARRGIDLHPADPRDPEAVRWLRALVWPEHAERAALLLEALAANGADPAPVEAGDALEVLPSVAARMPSEAVVVVSHSATLAHMPPEGRLRFAEALVEIAAERRILWLPLESDRSLAPPLAELIDLRAPGPPDGFVLALADLAPGRRSVGRVLAHAQWHGAWIEWRDRGLRGNEAPTG